MFVFVIRCCSMVAMASCRLNPRLGVVRYWRRVAWRGEPSMEQRSPARCSLPAHCRGDPAHSKLGLFGLALSLAHSRSHLRRAGRRAALHCTAQPSLAAIVIVPGSALCRTKFAIAGVLMWTAQILPVTLTCILRQQWPCFFVFIKDNEKLVRHTAPHFFAPNKCNCR